MSQVENAQTVEDGQDVSNLVGPLQNSAFSTAGMSLLAFGGAALNMSTPAGLPLLLTGMGLNMFLTTPMLVAARVIGEVAKNEKTDAFNKVAENAALLKEYQQNVLPQKIKESRKFYNELQAELNRNAASLKSVLAEMNGVDTDMNDKVLAGWRHQATAALQQTKELKEDAVFAKRQEEKSFAALAKMTPSQMTQAFKSEAVIKSVPMISRRVVNHQETISARAASIKQMITG